MRKSLQYVEIYTITSSKDYSYIHDQFGFLDKTNPFGLSIKNKPSNNKKDLITACKERMSSIATPYIAWSGGVDSTLLLAVAKSINKEIKPIYFQDDGIYLDENLREYVQDNFGLQIMSVNDCDYDKVMVASGADTLFYNTANIKGTKYSNEFVNGEIVTRLKPAPEEPIELLGGLKEYADYLDVEVKTNYDLLRLLTLGCKFWHYTYNAGIQSLLGDRQLGFYDTQEFIDIGFTQYWENHYRIKAPKTLERQYINEIFGGSYF